MARVISEKDWSVIEGLLLNEGRVDLIEEYKGPSLVLHWYLREHEGQDNYFGDEEEWKAFCAYWASEWRDWYNEHYFNELPGMVEEWNKLTDEEWECYYKDAPVLV